MNIQTISVIDAAKNLGKHKARVFKILGRLNIETFLEKNTGARGQKIAYITLDDYERVKEYFLENNDNTEGSSLKVDIGGVFYLIQLGPEHDPGRFKLGFATNLDE
jgi:hypothetical protein